MILREKYISFNLPKLPPIRDQDFLSFLSVWNRFLQLCIHNWFCTVLHNSTKNVLNVVIDQFFLTCNMLYYLSLVLHIQWHILLSSENSLWSTLWYTLQLLRVLRRWNMSSSDCLLLSLWRSWFLNFRCLGQELWSSG